MPSPALTAFDAAVDASNLSAGAKNTAKAWGERLYLAALKECAQHVRTHLDAEIAERAGDTEAAGRAVLIRTVLERVRGATDGLALTIAGALDG